MNKDDENLLAYAPFFKELTEEVLYKGVWERAQLNKRDRSIATLSALIALGRLEQLPHHISLAKTHEINKDELIEIFTHLAFYAGWPAAVSSIKRLHDIHSLEI